MQFKAKFQAKYPAPRPPSGNTSRAVLLAVGLAIATVPNSTLRLAAQTKQPQPATQTDCHRTESERFVFHSDPWINLHHFLFQWSRNVPDRQPRDRRRAVEVAESAQLENLSETEKQTWQQALTFYRDQLINGDLLFGRDLVALRGKLAAIACSAAATPQAESEIDTELRTVLVNAMDVYRQQWWPKHHAANMAWIEERSAQLKTHEATLAKRLAEAYGGQWPEERIRVDVAAYANWSGAYTTNNPDHVTIETSYRGLEGIETLFHEVSHASFFEQRILGQIIAAFRPLEADPPGRLLHAIQFATPAEILRSLLSPGEHADYRSVAEQVNERGPFRDQYRIVLKHWKPFLEGKLERADALAKIAREITAN